MAAANSCFCIISRRFWPRSLLKTAAINVSGKRWSINVVIIVDILGTYLIKLYIAGKHFSTSCRYANQKLQPHGQNVQSLNQKWRLVSAICVERLPVITQPAAEIESRVQGKIGATYNITDLD